MNEFKKYLPLLQDYLNKEFISEKGFDGEIQKLNHKGLLYKLLKTPCCNRKRLKNRKKANYYLQDYDLDLESIRGEIFLIYCQVVEAIKKKNIRNIRKYLFKSLNNYIRTHFTLLCKTKQVVPVEHRNKFITINKKGKEIMIPQAKYLTPDLSRLTPEQRYVVDCYFLQGFSIRKISELLDKSERTIKTIKAEALDSLHKIQVEE